MPVAADRAHSMSVSRFWNLGQSYASDIFISNVKHSRADYNLCWNVLRSVAYSESRTFRNKGKIFPGSIWCLVLAVKGHIYFPSPMTEEVCELL